ncbi:MAG TPA: HAD hydrolase family protein, partial [bacterium]|nr:HAD hydrolase family protein [bacterium]
ALMVVPAGASKGHGLYVALGVLGISHHNAIAFGDAENDHSLLEGCELGIAVANAVPALKARADIVLREPDGSGVAAFLRGPVLREGLRILPARWHVELGHYVDGFPVTLPASQVNVLIAGATATGKSWLAGLIAERLVEAEYSVCILDPEGDHPGLGRLRGVTTLGGPAGAPTVSEIRRNLQHRFGSVVVDASALSLDERPAFYVAALEQIDEQRKANGLPHWIFLDEAQLPAGAEMTRFRPGSTAAKGFCLVTWKPEDIAQAVLDDIDVLMLTSGFPAPEGLAWLPERFHREETEMALARLRPGEALLIMPGTGGGPRVFRTGARAISHVRHWHKYVTSRLPEHRRFHFVAGGFPTGHSAANLAEFHHEVQRAPAASLLHHAANRDFSRWVAEVIRDDALASALRGIETRFPANDARAAEAIRASVLEAIRARYLEEGGAAKAG